MRLAALIVCVLALAGAAGATSTAPTIRIVGGLPLTVVGKGFTPGVVVQVRLGIASGGARRGSVKVNRTGGFTARFSGLDKCGADQVTATTANGTHVRVPIAWFVRECPPPPPLAPGVY